MYSLNLPSFLTTICLCSLSLSLAGSSTLYATHYGGTVSGLELTKPQENASNPAYNFKVASNITACGSQPSWLTVHDKTNTLYCSDESNPGTLSAFKIQENGGLELSAKVQTISGGVYNGIYDAAGKCFIAVAHYSNMSVSTFQLPLSNSSQPQQVLNFSAPTPAIVDGKPVQPRPHQIVVDPTNKFIVVPDLGANMIRILAIDQTSGSLSECLAYGLVGGPRHAVFKPLGPDSSHLRPSANPPASTASALLPRYLQVSRHQALHASNARRMALHKRHDEPAVPQLALASGGAPSLVLQAASSLTSSAASSVVATPAPSGAARPPDYIMYVVTESANTVTAFRVSYANPACPSLHMIESQCGYPKCLATNAFAKAAEIRVKEQFLYISNRNDTHFPAGFDSITTWNVRPNDTLIDARLANAQGKWPRTFEINKKGDLVAVGNQVNATVFILSRNITTGEIGTQVASVRVGPAGNFSLSDGVSGGVSSVVWKEDEDEC